MVSNLHISGVLDCFSDTVIPLIVMIIMLMTYILAAVIY